MSSNKKDPSTNDPAPQAITPPTVPPPRIPNRPRELPSPDKSYIDVLKRGFPGDSDLKK